jgi:hypothetical protein
MSLTIEVEPSINTAVYNPIRFEFNSDVTSDYTIGAEAEAQDGQSNYNGYLQISLTNEHFLLVGDFILISQNAGIDAYNGVWLVTELIDDTQFIINAPYVGSGTSNIWYYKYLRNYNAVIRVFGFNYCDNGFEELAKLTLKPTFVLGYCYFIVDIADILKDYNSECNVVTDVISGDLFPLISPPIIQNNLKSYIRYYISYAEGFDNPVGNDTEYEETEPIDL